MGEAKNWKAQFLADHPICCFCGGSAATAEPDHQPGRVFFKDRVWPEGFVFPACEPCNRASRISEDLVALLTSHFDDEINRKKYVARAASARKNHPELIASLKMSSNQIRRASREIGIHPDPGRTYASLPIAKISPEHWLPHFRVIGKKIALGLHYQALKTALPPTGAIWLSFSTNADLRMEHDLNELLESAPHLVIPMRNRTELGDQLSIRYGSSAELGASIFIVSIQSVLVVTALCMINSAKAGGLKSDDPVERPFTWT